MCYTYYILSELDLKRAWNDPRLCSSGYTLLSFESRCTAERCCSQSTWWPFQLSSTTCSVPQIPPKNKRFLHRLFRLNRPEKMHIFVCCVAFWYLLQFLTSNIKKVMFYASSSGCLDIIKIKVSLTVVFLARRSQFLLKFGCFETTVGVRKHLSRTSDMDNMCEMNSRGTKLWTYKPLTVHTHSA